MIGFGPTVEIKHDNRRCDLLKDDCNCMVHETYFRIRDFIFNLEDESVLWQM